MNNQFFQDSSTEYSIYQSLKKSIIDEQGNLINPATLLKRAYNKFRSDTALIGTDKTVTYEEFYARSVWVSKYLAQKGIKPGDRVILMSENSLQFYFAYFGIWQLGAIVVPLNTFLHERELAYILQDAQPKAIIASPALKEKIEHSHKNGFIGDLPYVMSTADINMITPIQHWRDEIETFEVVSLPIEEMCLLLYTSGTTGVPKGVMLSGKNIMTNTLQAYARLKMISEEKERYLCVLPLFHVFAQNACIWLPIITGGSVVVVSAIDRKLILEGLTKNPTIFLGVPALYGLLCMMKNAPIDSVKVFVSGADALPDKIRAAFAMIYGRKICSGYGLTEASPVVAINIQNDELPTNSVGYPVMDLEYDIRDENGHSLSQGSIGDLWIKGDNIMMGYYHSQENTNAVIRNGWLNTGDLASFDQNGNLAIRGRTKDLIIHKGFNIYPQEVENVLMKHPSVFKVAVIGHQEDAAGQIPVAFIAIRGAQKANMDKELRDFCASYLATYKIPRKFICSEDLPMNATGKVDKKKLTLPPG